MKTNLNLPIKELSKENLANIKVICFDGDGVTKKKGTEFVMKDNERVMSSFPPSEDMVKKLKKLTKYFHVSISSGRSMSYLQSVYDGIGPENWSLQAEIGMYLYIDQLRVSNYELTEEQREKIEKIRGLIGKIKKREIKGFEPKEYLITVHCHERVEEIEKIVKREDESGELYCWWNEEAYDIGLKAVNKGTGVKKLAEKLGVTMSQVMTVGNGINDENMTDVVGIDVSTDPKHLMADFVVWGEEAGGEKVVDRILQLVEN